MAISRNSEFYSRVIEDVINKLRDEFSKNDGPVESGLNMLRGIWKAKIMEDEAIREGPINAPVCDPYEGSEQYETPTYDLLFPPSPQQTTTPGTEHTPLPGTGPSPLPGIALNPLTGMAYSSMVNIPTDGISFSPDESSSSNGLYMELFPMDLGEGESETAFSTWYNNAGYMPQQDGAGDPVYYDSKEGIWSPFKHEPVSANQEKAVKEEPSSSLKIPQLDGPIPVPYHDMLSPNAYNYQGVANEGYNVVITSAADMQVAALALLPQHVTVDDNDEEMLNENDDEIDDEQGYVTENLVLCLFDRVKHTKTKWKCSLSNGIIHINDKDIIFRKAKGDFEF